MGDLGCDELYLAVNDDADYAGVLRERTRQFSETHFHSALRFPAAFNSAEGVGNHNQGELMFRLQLSPGVGGRSHRGMVGLPAQSIGQRGPADKWMPAARAITKVSRNNGNSNSNRRSRERPRHTALLCFGEVRLDLCLQGLEFAGQVGFGVGAGEDFYCGLQGRLSFCVITASVGDFGAG